MNIKDEIRRCLDTQLTTSGNDTVQINRNDFDRILNRATHCSLIIITGPTPTLAEQLRSELESEDIRSAQNVIIKVSHSPTSELSCKDLVALLETVNDIAPTANIVWGYGADDKLAEGDCSIVLLIGSSAK